MHEVLSKALQHASTCSQFGPIHWKLFRVLYPYTITKKPRSQWSYIPKARKAIKHSNEFDVDPEDLSNGVSVYEVLRDQIRSEYLHKNYLVVQEKEFCTKKLSHLFAKCRYNNQIIEIQQRLSRTVPSNIPQLLIFTHLNSSQRDCIRQLFVTLLYLERVISNFSSIRQWIQRPKTSPIKACNLILKRRLHTLRVKYRIGKLKIKSYKDRIRQCAGSNDPRLFRRESLHENHTYRTVNGRRVYYPKCPICVNMVRDKMSPGLHCNHKNIHPQHLGCAHSATFNFKLPQFSNIITERDYDYSNNRLNYCHLCDGLRVNLAPSPEKYEYVFDSFDTRRNRLQYFVFKHCEKQCEFILLPVSKRDKLHIVHQAQRFVYYCFNVEAINHDCWTGFDVRKDDEFKQNYERAWQSSDEYLQLVREEWKSEVFADCDDFSQNPDDFLMALNETRFMGNGVINGGRTVLGHMAKNEIKALSISLADLTAVEWDYITKYMNLQFVPGRDAYDFLKECYDCIKGRNKLFLGPCNMRIIEQADDNHSIIVSSMVRNKKAHFTLEGALLAWEKIGIKLRMQIRV